ncbi:MAG: hypothetical protein QM652_03570 [Legionella sp.]|uniref:hypothetical protein n=1 Tax=Legionella sp. TaxID=459 RepID=UPI0039E61EDB
MISENYFDRASGVFFAAGFTLSKLKYLPFAALSATFGFIPNGLYLAGYTFWFLSNYFKPGHEKLKDHWYGFAKIKEQFLLSSFLGFIATALSIAAVFEPLIFIPAICFFVIGNAFWTIGEYHKLNNPPFNDENFSYARQKSYYLYSLGMTGISLVTAMTAIFTIAFPPATLSITVFSLLCCGGIGLYACEKWLNATFGDHKPSSGPSSHGIMSKKLGVYIANEPTHMLEPQHNNGLFKEPICTKSAIPTINSESSSRISTSSDSDLSHRI